MSRTIFVQRSEGQPLGPRRTRPLGRLIAMVGPVVGFSLLLLLSPASQVHGDYDDDDGQHQPRRTAPPCGCAPAPCVPSAPAPSSVLPIWPDYGCAEEYLGALLVHWHDFWKTCRPNPPGGGVPQCYGTILEGEPWYQEEKYLCKELEDCPRDKCCPPRMDSQYLQQTYALKSTTFEKADPNNTLMDADFDGYAELQHNGQRYTFLLYAIVTRYPNERIKTRLIGVQLKPGELTDADPKPRRAKWSRHEPRIGNAATGSDEHHWIDVELKTAESNPEDQFPKGSTERFHVTTVGPVPHE